MIEIKHFGIPTLTQGTVIYFFHKHRIFKVCEYKGRYCYPVVLSRNGAVNASRSHWTDGNKDYIAALNEFKMLVPEGRVVRFDETDLEGIQDMFSDFSAGVPLERIRAGKTISATELPSTPGECYLVSEDCLLRVADYVSLVAIRSACNYSLEPFQPHSKSAYIQKFLSEGGGKRRAFFFEPTERQQINQLITNFCNSVPVEAL